MVTKLVISINSSILALLVLDSIVNYKALTTFSSELND